MNMIDHDEAMSVIFILSIDMLCTESDSLELKQDNKNILTLRWLMSSYRHILSNSSFNITLAV